MNNIKLYSLILILLSSLKLFGVTVRFSAVVLDDISRKPLVNADADNSSGVERPNGWPMNPSYPNRFLHSDIKDVSYFFNFKVYEKLIEKGGMR